MTDTEPLGGRYHLIEEIGRGGTSVVWRAHDEILDRDVAVKVLSDSVDPRFWPAIRAEARAAGRLTNHRIAHVYDYGETSTPYLVAELVDGVPLSSRLADEPVLPWVEATVIAAQIAEALAAAHDRGLVHLDIKPDNVLLTADGVKLIDFGISALIGSRDGDDDGHLVGTLAYLAPERLADAPVGAAADVYALGVLLYRTLSGHLPWDDTDTIDLLHAHLYVEPTPLVPLDDAPLELSDICADCLDKDPRNRPTAADLARRLLLLTVVRREPLPPPLPGARVATRSAPRIAAWVAVTAAVVFAVGVLAWRGLPDQIAPRQAAAATPACTAAFSIQRDWGTGFAATLTVTNKGDATIPDWQVTFVFPSDQRIAPIASGTVAVSQAGPAVTVRPLGTPTTLPAGGSVSMPISAEYFTVNPIPTAFSLNGQPCEATVVPATNIPTATPSGRSRSHRGTPATVRSTTAPTQIPASPLPSPVPPTAAPSPSGTATSGPSPSATPVPVLTPTGKPHKSKNPHS